MKAVLMSIQPRWCELIASGKKTVEVRKTKPKLEVPFKVYIYETQGRTETPFVDEEGHHIFKGRGQVIGEFVCDRVICTFPWRLKGETGWCAKRTEEETHLPDMACLTLEEIEQYAGSRVGGIYGWYITDLVIYAEPRELRSFFKPRTAEELEADIAVAVLTCGIHGSPYTIKKPPQSWCYVEEVNDEAKRA